MGRRNRRVEKIMSDITDYFVDKIDRRIGEKVRKGLMVSDGLCKSKNFEKPKSDLKPKNLTVKEMQEKVKEHERKAAIYAKAITGDQEDYFNEYQKLMKTRIEDHTDNVKTNREKIMKDYEEAQLNLEKAEKKLFIAKENVQKAAKNCQEAEKKLSRFGDSKDGRKKIKNRQKTLKPKKLGDVDDYEKRADFLNEILNDDYDYQYEYEDRPENPPLEKVKNDDYDYNYEYESRGDFIDHPENASPKEDDEDDYKYEYEDREEHPNEKVYIFFYYKNF